MRAELLSQTCHSEHRPVLRLGTYQPPKPGDILHQAGPPALLFPNDGLLCLIRDGILLLCSDEKQRCRKFSPVCVGGLAVSIAAFQKG